MYIRKKAPKFIGKPLVYMELLKLSAAGKRSEATIAIKKIGFRSTRPIRTRNAGNND